MRWCAPADLVGSQDPALRLPGAIFVGRMQAGNRSLPVDPGAQARNSVETNPVVNRVGGRRSSATERNHGHTEPASIDRSNGARRRSQDVSHDRSGNKVPVQPVNEVCWPAKGRDHPSEALGRPPG